MAAVTALGLVTAGVVPLAAASASPAAPAAPSVASSGSAAAQPGAQGAVALKRIKKGLRVKVSTPSNLVGAVEVTVKGPKGWTRTITKTKRWKKAKPGTYRITAGSVLVAGLPTTASVVPKKAKVKVKKKGKKRGAQAKVTFRNPAPRCSATGTAALAVGANGSGQVGDGTTTIRRAVRTVADSFHGLRGVTAVAGGTSTGYALCANGTVWAWGQNGYGQLGNGSTASTSVWPVRVAGLTGVKAIAAGDRHAYALKSDGTVWSWGWGQYGQLGNGSTATRRTPVKVSGLSGVTAIASGHYAGYALVDDGTVRSWGIDTEGQLGDGGPTGNGLQSAVPVTVFGLSNVSAIAGGRANGYALIGSGGDAGLVKSWGSGSLGALGDVGFSDETSPTQVIGPSSTVGIAAGFSSGYAVLASGNVVSWGSDSQGQLGDGGTVGGSEPTGSVVPGLTDVKAVASHGYTVYALRTDGSVQSWGAGTQGQLGNGAVSSSSVPVVADVSGVKAVAAGGSTGYFLR